MTVGTGWGDDHYRQVAEVYMEAFEDFEQTNREVALTWDVPQTTADRWVRVARERGYLPSTVKGRPGWARCRGACPVHCVHTPVDAPARRLPPTRELLEKALEGDVHGGVEAVANETRYSESYCFKLLRRARQEVTR